MNVSNKKKVISKEIIKILMKIALASCNKKIIDKYIEILYKFGENLNVRYLTPENGHQLSYSFGWNL